MDLAFLSPFVCNRIVCYHFSLYFYSIEEKCIVDRSVDILKEVSFPRDFKHRLLVK